jgi:hypothetical protein
MEQERKALNIHQAMILIMRSVEAIKKEKINTQGQGFKYRGIDDVMNSLHNAFAEAGVFITPEVLERTEVERVSKNGGALFYVTQKIKYTFHAEDGSFITSTVNGTAMDSGDKADNKSLSIGLKYALLQAFLIPTDDMQEPDAQTHEVKPKTQAAATPAAKPAAQVKLTDVVFKKAIARLEAGDDIIDSIRKTYTLTPDQEKAFEKYQKTGEVAA